MTGSSARSASSATPSGAVTVQATRESATAGYMTIASTSTIVQMVSRCMVARCWAMGTTRTVCASPRANTRRASRSAPPGVVRSPDADRHDAVGQQQDVAALEVLQAGAVELLHPGEARVVGVDGGGDGALPVPRRHRQRRHRDLVAHPDRGVAGEQQVGQRGDDEVAAVHHPVGQAVAAAQLVVGQPRDEGAGEVLGRQVAQVCGRDALQRRPEPRVVDGRGDQLGPRRGEGQHLGEQPVEVQHLDAALGQRRREGVVLLLRAVHPRDAVEEQLVVVARGEPPQLGPGPVQHHRAQSAHLAGGAHGRGGLGNSVGGPRLDHGQRLAQAGAPAARPPSLSCWIVCGTAAGGVAGPPDRRCPWTCST